LLSLEEHGIEFTGLRVVNFVPLNPAVEPNGISRSAIACVETRASPAGVLTEASIGAIALAGCCRSVTVLYGPQDKLAPSTALVPRSPIRFARHLGLAVIVAFVTEQLNLAQDRKTDVSQCDASCLAEFKKAGFPHKLSSWWRKKR
jgi:hypothetical protein